MSKNADNYHPKPNGIKIIVHIQNDTIVLNSSICNLIRATLWKLSEFPERQKNQKT